MKDVEKFKTWLADCGAVVLAPTNEWEVVRFRNENGTSIVYQNARGHLTFTGESEEAYKIFKQGKRWKVVNRKREILRSHKAVLAARDGKHCFACLEDLPFNKLTIEHILSFAHGGTDNDNNLCLLCKTCNTEMGSLSIVKKIELIMEIRRREKHRWIASLRYKEMRDNVQETV